MKISATNFIASQALYGLMIAHPRMPEDEAIRRSYRIARKMVNESRKKPKCKKH